MAGRLALTAERKERLHLTSEVFPLVYATVTREPTPAVQTAAALQKHKVGIVGASQGLVGAAKQAGLPQGRLEGSFKEPSELALALRSVSVTAVVLSLDQALVAQRQDLELRIGVAVTSPERSTTTSPTCVVRARGIASS